ncbi:hypothetical protein HYW17_05945 [Candidatus Uhrbacteria bacterium]|nr:hypothetical protein [Candidatus Uhrbacteria bacterium]
MKNTKLITYALVVLFIGSAAAAFYFYNQYTAIKDNPQRVAQADAKALVTKLGRLIVLPEGEEPTVATVSDPEALKDQPFFANAQKGFRVFIYTNAKKAILYDPVANKIVEVAPINIGAPATPAPAAPAPKK